MKPQKLTLIVLQAWCEVQTVNYGQHGSSAPDTRTDLHQVQEQERWRSQRQAHLHPRPPAPAPVFLMTSDRGQPLLPTSWRGWDKSSLPIDTWQRREGRISVRSWVLARISWRSGSRTREPSWRSLLERRGNLLRCWSLKDYTITKLFQ